jgi:type IV pilus assembly protein PilP
MMRLSAFILLTFLSGCSDNNDDLKEYITQVQANTNSAITPMLAVPKFNHVAYNSTSNRSPFVLPKPEAIQQRMQQMAGCLSPDPRRRKQPLEKYSLSNLTMRGTLGELGVTWALVEATDSTLHRVNVGGYIGMYNGKISEVKDDLIKVVELVPDGAGCWVERESIIAMAGSSAEGQRK